MERMIDAETEELSKREKYRERRGEEYDVVSKVAFLIGVPDSHWKSQYTGLDSDIYEQLSDNRDARIIRNLCGLRTEIERNFKHFSMLILMELKNLHTIPQTQGMVNQLRKDGIDIIKANPKLEEYLPKINALLQQHIDACKSLFPIWVNWEFVRQLFIIPGGNSTKKSKEVFEYYMENLERYPYRMFINWRWSKDEEGNLLYNDEKFLSRLYQQNGEVFTGYSNVRGEGRETKRNIYGFVDASEQTVALVDCENCDPLKLCAALQSMQPETLAKITKIILYNDVNASSAWNLLQKHTRAVIEHQMSERVLTGKSLVDVMLVAEYQVIPIVCVDDRFGMAFNKRRCSSDVAILKDILGRTDNAKLWTDSYSAKLFSPESEILVDDRAFEKAEAGEYVFCERVDPGKYQDRIEKVLVYFWNRNARAVRSRCFRSGRLIR